MSYRMEAFDAAIEVAVAVQQCNGEKIVEMAKMFEAHLNSPEPEKTPPPPPNLKSVP